MTDTLGTLVAALAYAVVVEQQSPVSNYFLSKRLAMPREDAWLSFTVPP